MAAAELNTAELNTEQKKTAEARDAIVKILDLKAPVDRVWRALTDHREFGQWFQVALDGPFEVGELSTGRITHAGCDHMIWRATVTVMESPSRFAFTWNPFSEGDGTDRGPATTVEFRLQELEGGTRLHISESGFSAMTDEDRRREVFWRNEGGWTQQVQNIVDHVES